ncbi:MAG: glycerol-3-phosphate 1-O-acyltransferase PlsY [Armatimonadota bacterium]
MKELVVLAVSFLCGSLPIGVIVGKLARGIDIRDYGSGNIGATNVLRTLGLGPAIVVSVGDTLKGLVPVLLAMRLISGSNQALFVVAAGLLAIVGHSASPFLKFKGGKGVATSLGMIIGMNPVIATIGFGLWALIVAITRYVSIASIITPFAVTALMYFSSAVFGRDVPREYMIVTLAASLLILLRHRSNIKRLLKGTEPKIGQKA